jgi:hypothetical protein
MSFETISSFLGPHYQIIHKHLRGNKLPDGGGVEETHNPRSHVVDDLTGQCGPHSFAVGFDAIQSTPSY